MTTSRSYVWDEDQLAVLADEINYGVILINSVPGSGKTQLLIEKTLASGAAKTLIISMTNAVRTEIADRIKDTCERNEWSYEYKIEAHHNIFTVGSTSVHVATLDSWVFESIVELSKLYDNGGCSDVAAADHEGRRALLLDKYISQGCWPETCLLDYDQVAIDEIQDLDHHFYCIVVAIARGICFFEDDGPLERKHRRMILAGDPDQNVFARSEYCIVEQLRRDLALYPDFREYDLRYNHRCPPAHIRFANEALKPVCLGREIKWTPGKPEGLKPVLVKVTGGFTSDAYEKRAEEVFKLIMVCHADDYAYHDIAVLAPTTKTNKLYGHLEFKLRRALDHPGFACRVAWLYSDKDDVSDDGIDWSGTSTKLVMSSIHANKGRTHKVVIVCDFTDGVFPKIYSANETRPMHIEAQVSQALVALTRATDRLYILYSDPVTRFFGPDLARLDPFCEHRVTDSYLTTLAFKTSKGCVASTLDAPVYNPNDPLANLSAPPMESFTKTTVRRYLQNKLWAQPSASISMVTHIVSATTDQGIFRVHRIGRHCCSMPGSESVLDLMKRENLAQLYGYFGQCLVYHEVYGLPLTPQVSAYGDPIVTESSGVHYFFNRIMEPWSVAVSRNSAEWIEYPRRELASVNPESGRPTYYSIETDAEVQEIYNIVMRIVAAARKDTRLTPNHFVVVKKYEMNPRTASLPYQMVQSIKKYKRCKSREALWNVAIMMTGLNNGVFDARPWLKVLMSSNYINVRQPIFDQIVHNTRSIIDALGAQVVKHHEYPVVVENQSSTGTLWNLTGRVDLVLPDGTLVDVKCSMSDKIFTDDQDFDQQTKVLDPAALQMHQARDICQLLLYAQAVEAPRIQIWDVGAGTIQTADMKDYNEISRLFE